MPVVDQARRTLGILAIVLTIVGLLLCIVVVIGQLAPDRGLPGVGTPGVLAVWIASYVGGPIQIFIGPIMLVLGLHMLLWRALVRPLARMKRSTRTITIISVGTALSLLSVIAVVALLLLGYVFVAWLFNATSTSF